MGKDSRITSWRVSEKGDQVPLRNRGACDPNCNGPTRRGASLIPMVLCCVFVLELWDTAADASGGHAVLRWDVCSHREWCAPLRVAPRSHLPEEVEAAEVGQAFRVFRLQASAGPDLVQEHLGYSPREFWC